MAKKQTAKDIMLAHSAAKVEYYQKYLTCYLSIMSVTRKIDEVNIFDVFCGRGVYADGGLGSPIRTVQAVKEVRDTHPSDKRINLFFNDAEDSYVKQVKQYINENYPDNKNFCKITYLCGSAEELLKKLCGKLSKTSFTTKNFFFIDPYGYKSINRYIFQHTSVH